MVIYMQHILSIGFLCVLSFLLKRSGCYSFQQTNNTMSTMALTFYRISIIISDVHDNRDMLCINMKSYKILYILRCKFFSLRYFMCFLKGIDAGQMLYATIYRS